MSGPGTLGPGPVVTVTPNPALDVTYRVRGFRPGTSHRVEEVHERAGGKGVNVASVLHTLGVPVLATGLVAGAAGQRVRDDLDARGVPHDFAQVGGETRRTVTVVDGEGGTGDATAFNEPGPLLGPTEWDQVGASLEVLLDRVRPSVVVVSGSLPRGLGGRSVAQVLGRARDVGAATVLDTAGGVLLETLDALRPLDAPGPDVVKPNVHELAELLAAARGRGPLEDEVDPAAVVASGVALLRSRGARTVLVSAGGDGLRLHPRDRGALTARLARPLTGHPTGAGDAAVAAVAAGLRSGAPWPDVLVDAVAWSAAAVLRPVAGEVDLRDVARLRGQVLVTPADP